jgi:hypothetical protein
MRCSNGGIAPAELAGAWCCASLVRVRFRLKKASIFACLLDSFPPTAPAEKMQRLRFALTSLLPHPRAAIVGRSMSAGPSFIGSQAPAAVPFRPFPVCLQKSFSTSANSTLPSLSEAKDVLNSQGSIRVRKALEIDGRSKMDSKEFMELCR